MSAHAYRLLEQEQDVSDHLLVLVVNCVEDWFPPGHGPMIDGEFIDYLSERYLNREGWDIERLDTPAVRKMMRHAHRVRREMA